MRESSLKRVSAIILTLAVTFIMGMSTATAAGLQIVKTAPKDGEKGQQMDNMSVKIYFNREVYSKKNSKANNKAFEMLSILRKSTHRVISGLYILSMLSQNCDCIIGKESICCAVETKVSFGPYSDKDIWEYINTGDPMDKAGAYGIQGNFGRYVKSYEGSYFNVVGFPAEEFIKQLKNL